MATPLPLLLDTDIGTDVDDAIGIGFLLAAPEFEVAVTVDAPRGVEFLVQRLLQLP